MHRRAHRRWRRETGDEVDTQECPRRRRRRAVPGIDERAAGKLVDVIVGEIAAQLRAHREVYVPAFGTFRVKRRSARTYRTPSGTTVDAPAKTVITVKTSEIFARRVLDAEE